MANELTSREPKELSADINVITAEINAYQRVAGEAIFEIGRRLKHVKENDLAHGEWMKWCKDELNMTTQHANRFVRVYDRFSNRTPVFSLSISVLEALIPLTDEQLTQEYEFPDGTKKKPIEMSRREAERMKRRERERDEAKKQAEAERKERERLEAENEKLSNREPDIEMRTEYVEIDNTPSDYDDVKRRLEKYHEKFGDIRDYDGSVTATHVQDMISATMSFKKAVKEIARRFSYMTKYKDAINRMDHISKQG